MLLLHLGWPHLRASATNHNTVLVTLTVQGDFEELRGTLYRAGAMRFASADGEPYGHWFDGDGSVYGFRTNGPSSLDAIGW